MVVWICSELQDLAASAVLAQCGEHESKGLRDLCLIHGRGSPLQHSQPCVAEEVSPRADLASSQFSTPHTWAVSSSMSVLEAATVQVWSVCCRVLDMM